MNFEEPRFSPSLCVTHECNLNCIYCYQKHKSGLVMPLDVAKRSIDWIFTHVPEPLTNIEISFIGGEPLLAFNRVKEIVEYTWNKWTSDNYIFFASTNGTVLNKEMKEWFIKNRNRFYLGVSIDGTKTTHDYNRSNSFDKIDIGFFKDNWPKQGVKMTLSEYSLSHLAEDVKYIHSLGFDVHGVNLAEGDFDWDNEKYISILIPQLNDLVEYYVDNNSVIPCQILDKHLDACEVKKKWRNKWCGIGNGTNFFDIDGRMFPCSFTTPMTFSENDIENMLKTDFTDDENFMDNDCYNNCYIYPICSNCSGANYMVNGFFNIRNKKKCKINKLIALYIADLQAKKIAMNLTTLEGDELYYTIEAIKKIRTLYLNDFIQYF